LADAPKDGARRRLRTESGGRVERAPRTAGIAGPMIHTDLNSPFINMVSNARYQSTVAEDRSQANSVSSGGEEIVGLFSSIFQIFFI
jgi:hypothetical protein